MMKTRKISVVIATYNRRDILPKCINSVINQDYPRNGFEIIIVNDCSTDDTYEYARALAKKHRSIRAFSHNKNKGEAAARNTGIKAAKGEIIAFLDDDCIAGKNWLFSISAAFRKGIDGVEGRTIARGRKGPFDNYVENNTGGRYMTCNMSYRSSVIKKTGCDERFRHANRVDSDLAFSVMEKGKNLVFEKNAIAEHSVLRSRFMAKLRKKKFFMNDALLYKKHPAFYKKYIRFPFEKFTPFYILFSLLSFINPLMVAGVFLTAGIEIASRKWAAGLYDFLRFTALQAIGSFMIIVYVLCGCWKYRTSLRIFLV